MIMMTKRHKFRALLALIIIGLMVNGYFYFFNQNYLKYILFWTTGLMLLASLLSYRNGKRLGANSLGKIWILFATGLSIWTFTNLLSSVYTLVFQRTFPYLWALIIVDLLGYSVFAYANVYLTKFINLIRTGKPKFPWMNLAFLLMIASLSFVGIALVYTYLAYGSNYLFIVYLLADVLIAGSLFLPLLSLKDVSVHRPFMLFIFGFIFLIIAESSYFFLVVSGFYKYLFIGSPQHFLYMLAFGIFALGAYDQRRQLS